MLLCPWDFPGKSTGVGCHCLLWGTCPEKTIIQEDTCTPVFTAALFTIARTWKKPACQYRRHKRQITYLYGEGDGTHSSTLAWKIPWIEEPGRLQSMGSLRVGHD